jgi:hypothetical protein
MHQGGQHPDMHIKNISRNATKTGKADTELQNIHFATLS